MNLRTERRRHNGFTLIEALVAIVLVGTAIVAAVGGLASLTQAFRRSVEREEIQRLATQKLDELIATGEWATVSDGTFDEEQFEDFTWALATETTGIEGLEYVQLTVTLERAGRTDTDVAESLAYRTTATTVPGGTDG